VRSRRGSLRRENAILTERQRFADIVAVRLPTPAEAAEHVAAIDAILTGTLMAMLDPMMAAFEAEMRAAPRPPRQHEAQRRNRQFVELRCGPLPQFRIWIEVVDIEPPIRGARSDKPDDFAAQLAAALDRVSTTNKHLKNCRRLIQKQKQ
jgi:hypothetical protein